MDLNGGSLCQDSCTMSLVTRGTTGFRIGCGVSSTKKIIFEVRENPEHWEKKKTRVGETSCTATLPDLCPVFGFDQPGTPPTLSRLPPSW